MIDTVPEGSLLLAGLAGLFGLLIGSFLNVVIHRLPRMLERDNVAGVVEWFDDLDGYVGRFVKRQDASRAAALKAQLRGVKPAFVDLAAALPAENLVRPGSRCSACGHRITALENIPVLSYLVLRGRCKACAAPISPRYPAVELLTGVLFAAVAWRFGLSIAMFGSLVLVAALVALTFIDADAMLLPDSITLPLLWLGLMFAAEGGFVPLGDAVWGAVAGYLSLWSVYWAYKLATGKEGFGYGDFKLLAALGAWFGWQSILPIILMSAVVGATVGIALIIAGRKTLASRLPFGVYLAPAGLLMLFAGRQVIESILPGFA